MSPHFNPELNGPAKTLDNTERELLKGMYSSLVSVLGNIKETLKDQEPEGANKTQYGAVISPTKLVEAIETLEDALVGGEDITTAIQNLGVAIKDYGAMPLGAFQTEGNADRIMMTDSIKKLVANLEQLYTELDSLKILLGDKQNIVNQLQLLQEEVAGKINTFRTKTLPNLEGGEK